MTSLRISQPDSRIVAVIDDQSDHCPGIDAIERIANDVVRVRIDHPDAIYRSRKLKIGLRKIFSGNLLYLDCDTFIMGSINGIWQCEADVAAAPDIAAGGHKYSSLSIRHTEFRKLGWNLTSSIYLNSGVVFLRDNPAVYEFSGIMKQSWVNFSDQFGKYNDQPAFNNALSIIADSHDVLSPKIKITVLPQIWNAQITMDQALGRRAKVIHVFSGDFDSRNDTVIHVAAKQLKQTGIVNVDYIAEAIKNGHVWINLDSVRKFYAAGMLKNAILKSLNNLKIINFCNRIGTVC